MTAQPIAEVTLDNGATVDAFEPSAWDVSRSVAAWGLPGQALVPTGVGTGSGSCTIEDLAAPGLWGMSWLVRPGVAVKVQGSHDTFGLVSDARWPLLSGVVRSLSADGIDSRVRTLAIEDETTALNRPALVREAFVAGPAGSVIDAAYLVDQAVRSAGYRQAPPTLGSTLLSLPMAGCAAPEVGTSDAGTTAATWTTVAGRIAVSGFPENAYTFAGPNPTSVPLRLSVIAAGQCQFGLYAYTSTVPTTPTVILRRGYAGDTWQASRDGGSTWQIIDGVADGGLTEILITWVSSTQIQVKSRSYGNYSEVQSAPEWGTTWTLTGAAVTGNAWRKATASGTFSGLQIFTGDNINTWTPPTAIIEASGVGLSAALIPKDIKAWDLAQQVTKASAAALWRDERGRVRFRPRSSITSQASSETVNAMTDLGELSWSASVEDHADRLEVTYTPPVTATVANGSLPVWEATEVIVVPAGGTVVIEEALEVAAKSLAAWAMAPITPGSTIPSTGSVWGASDAPKGGTRVSSGITVTSTLISPQRLRVTIVSTRGTPTYMCDINGSPVLIQRANQTIAAGDSATYSLGATAIDAQVPASIDGGLFIQSASAATTFGADIWAALQAGVNRPVFQGLEVWPHAGRTLLSIITITDKATPNTAYICLIIGIRNSGSAGVWQQYLDLAVLATQTI
ncbi:hypothetical protein GCM10010401_07470 [Rarobacter faecitabidus]|uniref:Uncharacterized protein n=1 Tax=Rarobacter faecitabidus TaxID=13243 RepID=A0A542ZAK2_RARFA|nr:hypothetical protein [Rarobacter faecitabidus]TQL57356.1 hypothetical protein FB461_2088 [Rarobacter faecitabidus]